MGHLLCYIAFFAVSRTLTPSLSCISANFQRDSYVGTLTHAMAPLHSLPLHNSSRTA